MENKALITILIISCNISNIVLLREHFANKKFKDIEKKMEYSEKLNEYCRSVSYLYPKEIIIK